MKTFSCDYWQLLLCWLPLSYSNHLQAIALHIVSYGLFMGAKDRPQRTQRWKYFKNPWGLIRMPFLEMEFIHIPMLRLKNMHQGHYLQ